MNCRCSRIVVAVISLLVDSSSFETLHAEEARSSSSESNLELICFSDRPVVPERSNTKLRALASTSDGNQIGAAPTFAWQVTAGVVRGAGAEVQWDLSTVSIGPNDMDKPVLATVTAEVPGIGKRSCEVTVFLERLTKTESARPLDSTRGLISAHRFLLPNEQEKTGYGLYSYLLFRAPPQNPEEEARYLKTLESYLAQLRDVEELLQRHVRPSQLNVSRIPVTTRPHSDPSLTKWAENVLAVYDYATAEILLNKLDKAYQRGPYLISVQRPLTQTADPVSLHLLQDLTGMVPGLAKEWVIYFTYVTAQQRSWADQSLHSFTLKLRNTIAVASKVTPEVAKSLVSMIQLIRVGA